MQDRDGLSCKEDRLLFKEDARKQMYGERFHDAEVRLASGTVHRRDDKYQAGLLTEPTESRQGDLEKVVDAKISNSITYHETDIVSHPCLVSMSDPNVPNELITYAA